MFCDPLISGDQEYLTSSVVDDVFTVALCNHHLPMYEPR